MYLDFYWRFLWRDTAKSQILEEKLRRIQDDSSEERTLLLSQKNKALQEKQDYEIYNATLKERNRIAREIHDNVGHVLSRSILMMLPAKPSTKMILVILCLEILRNP